MPSSPIWFWLRPRKVRFANDPLAIAEANAFIPSSAIWLSLSQSSVRFPMWEVWPQVGGLRRAGHWARARPDGNLAGKLDHPRVAYLIVAKIENLE